MKKLTSLTLRHVSTVALLIKCMLLIRILFCMFRKTLRFCITFSLFIFIIYIYIHVYPYTDLCVYSEKSDTAVLSKKFVFHLKQMEKCDEKLFFEKKQTKSHIAEEMKSIRRHRER